ncbi:MAG: hypothetical protein SFZ23_10020 [Planctomycetota bacterium]|nr:hypothetical protein [Planctomycetota bacterium]
MSLKGVVRPSVISVIALAGTSSLARAQLFWANPIDGSWFDFTKWNQPGPPDSAINAQLGWTTPYEVTVLNNFADCRNLTIGNPGATIRIGAAGGNSRFTIHGTQLDNAGTIRVGGAGNTGAAAFQVGNNIAIIGSGRIVLDRQAGAATINGLNGIPYGIVHGAGHTIEGAGQISSPLLNDGTIDANVAGRDIEFVIPSFPNSASITNNNLIRASSGGSVRLSLSGAIIAQGPSGELRAESDSSLLLLGGIITGGRIATAGTGLATVFAQGYPLDGVTLTSGSRINAVPNSGIEIRPAGLTNNGAISLDRAYLRSVFAQSATVSGTGRVSLLEGSLANFGSGGGYALVNAPGHTFGGTGTIALALTNRGTVRADRNSQTSGPTDLRFTQTNKINEGLIVASNAGNAIITDVTMTQTGAGTLRAEDGSAITLSGSSTRLVGGRLETAGSGVFSVDGDPVQIADLTIAPGAQVLVSCSRRLRLEGSIVNNGRFTVDNNGCGSSFAEIRAQLGATLSGTGEVRLAARQTSTAVRLIGDGGPTNPLRLASSQALTGTGELQGRLELAGVVSPDQTFSPFGPVGRFELSSGAALSLAPSSSTVIDLASASSFDRVNGGGAITLAGELQLRLVGSFVPELGVAFDVIAGPNVSGVFDAVSITPPVPGGLVRVEYLPTVVRVSICFADFNSDGQSDFFDYLDFAAAFSVQQPDADINRDGQIDFFDYLDFASEFASGC